MPHRLEEIALHKQKLESGSAMLLALVTLTIVGLGTYAMQSGLLQSLRSQQRIKDTSTYDMAIESSATRIEALLAGYSSYCGQSDSMCPGIFPDPLNCANARLRQFVSSNDWGYEPPTSSGDHFIAPTSFYTNRPIPTPSGPAKLDVSSLARVPGNLGYLWFESKIYGSLDKAASEKFMTQDLSLYDPGRKGKRIIASVDGFECSNTGFVSAVYFHTAAENPAETTSSETNIRYPITIPVPKCDVSLSAYMADEGATLRAILITSGAWQTAIWPRAAFRRCFCP